MLLSALLGAATPLDNARRAQALLGPEVWSRVIEIDNAAGGARYPALVHALVFEFAGILWFYADADGTQSFSLHRGQLAAEKADFAPLLREIDPGFLRWRALADDGAPAPGTAAAAEPLLNGCFVESVAAWRRRVARGEETGAPRLLSYYFKPGVAKAGHTVLAFEARGRLEIFDPARPERRFEFSRRAGSDALRLARELDGRAVARARFLELPEAPPAAVADAPAAAGRAGATL
ncbi:MAG: hypothetical protein JNL39_22615 [Opitutaceae bacterium]|nr:hypothetical protein [Opitutaceae bacterium]